MAAAARPFHGRRTPVTATITHVSPRPPYNHPHITKTVRGRQKGRPQQAQKLPDKHPHKAELYQKQYNLPVISRFYMRKDIKLFEMIDSILSIILAQQDCQSTRPVPSYLSNNLKHAIN